MDKAPPPSGSPPPAKAFFVPLTSEAKNTAAASGATPKRGSGRGLRRARPVGTTGEARRMAMTQQEAPTSSDPSPFERGNIQRSTFKAKTSPSTEDLLMLPVVSSASIGTQTEHSTANAATQTPVSTSLWSTLTTVQLKTAQLVNLSANLAAEMASSSTASVAPITPEPTPTPLQKAEAAAAALAAALEDLDIEGGLGILEDLVQQQCDKFEPKSD